MAHEVYESEKVGLKKFAIRELMISNVVCENLLIIIYFQFIWR